MHTSFDIVFTQHKLRICAAFCVLLILAASAVTILPSPTVAQANPACNAITIENQNPGTDAWIITNPANDSDHQIKGYASANSVDVGDTIAFHVSVTPAQTYTIDIFRASSAG